MGLWKGEETNHIRTTFMHAIHFYKHELGIVTRYCTHNCIILNTTFTDCVPMKLTFKRSDTFTHSCNYCFTASTS